ncbi:pantoate--beta-alanine ligase [Opitutaceae bacterium TAV4]|uniref:pantoate--beta-alanine ligase n=1 Tax=Geminisphaera colitermitum TaxID=1148786 RepID=UPI000158C51C|nr:pantoate--beta-alanine ligase [Geminisphaera colitermitum]RRJ96120.1 pantoate--beta-alanine ligase [Opitutaceae bacterium TAV4]RRK00252.1 pantoate--beta-alanine ligase [Opitutaceae bacterium TAV3]
MQTITSVFEMQTLAEDLRSKGQIIGLVPTMGALHEGHLSLIRLAAERADTVIVSIFVNPTQFAPSEDFSKYPRELESDAAKCEAAGADIVFAPIATEMYPKGYSTYINEEFIARPLEGVSRPTHFRGVTTIVAKLFNICRPDLAVFGQKDAQQVAVIKKMVNDLNFTVDVVTAPTVREADGLALSSRNRYLTSTQRTEALAISRALTKAREMVAAGERRADRLVAEVTHLLSQHRRIRVIYASLVDRCTMEPVREVIPGKAILAIAAWVDEVRLIDNIVL